jgi:hypothetical protein
MLFFVDGSGGVSKKEFTIVNVINGSKGYNFIDGEEEDTDLEADREDTGSEDREVACGARSYTSKVTYCTIKKVVMPAKQKDLAAQATNVMTLPRALCPKHL